MLKFDKKLFYYKLPPVLYSLLILVVSTIPNAQPPKLDISNIDKFYHGLQYFLLGILIFRAFPSLKESPRRRLYYSLLFLFGLVFGAADETVQSFVPTRDSSFGDWIADAIGYLAGGTLYLSVFARRRKMETKQS